MTAVAIAIAAAAGVHAVLEPVASHLESERGAYLWHAEEWLQLFTPARYEGRGRGRLLVYGPSETREALIPSRMEDALPGLGCLQNAQSMGTLEDGLVLLEYIEREFGDDALPSAVVLALSPRFVANIRTERSPLLQAIDRYAPHLKVADVARRPRLEPKRWHETLRSLYAHRKRQQRRYQATFVALAREILEAAGSDLADDPRLASTLSPAKYTGLPPYPEAETRAWLAHPESFWARVHAWDPDADRERILRELAEWRERCRAYGADLYVVNMPEVSWNRDLYPPGRSERYLAIVREALGDTPFLDLRTFLPDEEYFDSCHPIWEGCVKVSDAVGAFVARERATRGSSKR